MMIEASATLRATGRAGGRLDRGRTSGLERSIDWSAELVPSVAAVWAVFAVGTRERRRARGGAWGGAVPSTRGEQRDYSAGSERGLAAGPEVTDAMLLVRAGRGDTAAFRAIVERHLAAAVAIARRMLRDDAEAEDIAQEAMVRLWRGAADLDVGPSGARPWLRRVVSNLCIDRIRASQRTEVTDDVPDGQADADQLRGLAEMDLSARVDAALKRLPERQRLALTLFHYEGLSQIEIGEIMGVSDEAVESLLGRARRALKAALKDDWRQLLWET